MLFRSENFALEKVIAGDMDELIAALQEFDRKERLASLKVG